MKASLSQFRSVASPAAPASPRVFVRHPNGTREPITENGLTLAPGDIIEAESATDSAASVTKIALTEPAPDAAKAKWDASPQTYEDVKAYAAQMPQVAIQPLAAAPAAPAPTPAGKSRRRSASPASPAPASSAPTDAPPASNSPSARSEA